jgi:CBS domain-containing protein
VDENGQLLGMLSQGDLMRHYGADHQRKRAWFLEQLSEGQKMSKDFLDSIRLDMLSAKDLMSKSVISATPETPLSAIVDLMLNHKVKRVAIVTDGKLVGLVSRADLMKRIVDAPDDVLDFMVNPN